MRYLLLLILLYSGIGVACVVGPKKIVPTKELGFIFKNEPTQSCENCSMFTIDVPKEFKSMPAAHTIFSVYENNELIVKTVVPFKKGFNESTFTGFVSNKKGVSYDINIEYGNAQCMGYQFNYSGNNDGS